MNDIPLSDNAARQVFDSETIFDKFIRMQRYCAMIFKAFRPFPGIEPAQSAIKFIVKPI